MKNMKSIKLLLPSQFKTGFYLLFLYTRQSMRLLTAGSLVRVQLGEPCRSKVRFAPAYFLPLAENKPSARSCLPSCGTRLWLRRINRLANRRPLRQQILAVSRAAGARICCQLFAGLKFVSCFLSIICFFNAFHIGGEFVFFYRIQYLQHDYVLFKDIFCFLQLTAYTPPVKKQALKALKHFFLFY